MLTQIVDDKNSYYEYTIALFQMLKIQELPLNNRENF